MSQTSYVAGLEARIADSQDDVQQSHSPQSESPVNAGLVKVVVSSRGTMQYLGSSSAVAPLRKLSIASEVIVDRDQPRYNEDALRRRSSVSVHLPPYRIAQRYFQAQYAMLGTIFAFVSPEDFEVNLLEALQGPPDISDNEACLRYCQVLMCLAFGQMYEHNKWYNSDGPPGFAYLAQALQYLPEIHSEPSVGFCQALCLIGYFMQNLVRRDAAYMYLGLAQRMAISLALHEEVSDFDETVQEQRRRTWWSIYSLDRIFCVKYGNLITMDDEDISVRLPSRLPQEPEFCAAVVLRHYTQLSQILSSIMSRIYGTAKTETQLRRAVHEIKEALVRWEQDVPQQLRFSADCSREAISTCLHYYQCISMTARPLLFLVVERRLQGTATDDWQTGWETSTIDIVEMCIKAAKDTIAIMTAGARRNLVAVFGYMDGEHTFCAALVMVMVCIAFPYDAENEASMYAGLAILDSFAAEGNQHIETRHQMLMQLLDRANARPPEQPASTDFLPMLHEDVLNVVFPAITDGDANDFVTAYSGTAMNIESEMEYLMQFPGIWTDMESEVSLSNEAAEAGGTS